MSAKALGEQASAELAALPIAPDILAVIERRIGLLSPPARHLAQLAAIAGECYSVSLAAAALACAPLALSEPLRELELRQVLYGRHFVHEVIAVAVERTIARSVAEFMHRFVAEYLVQHGGEPARVAAHWVACGEDRRAGNCYSAAAAAAAEALRPIEQCQLLDAAAACFERAGAQSELFDALQARESVSAAPDHAVVRLALIERLEALANTDEQRLHALLCRQGWDADFAHTDAVDVGIDAIRRALAIGKPAIAFAFARSTAWRLAMRGDEALALHTVQAHRPWVIVHGSAIERAHFHASLAGVLGYCDRLRPAIDAARLAVAELRAAARLADTLPILSNMGLYLYWCGELDEAKAVLEEAASLRDRMHGSGSALVIDTHLGAVLRDRGDYAAAETLLTTVVDALRANADRAGSHTDTVIGENQLAQLYLSLGQPGRALELLAGDDADVALRFRGRRVALRLRAARLLGRAEPGLLAQARAMVETHDSPFNRALLELEVAYALPAEEALTVCTRLLGERATLERPGLCLHVAARAAEAALALGRPADAMPQVVQVQRLLARFAPFDIERAQVWHIVADVLLANGDPVAAADVLQGAAAALHESAQAHAPTRWRESYLQRNPANRRLLRAAARR